MQEIAKADTHVRIAAELVTQYRKNVQYNLDATRAVASIQADTGDKDPAQG